MENLRKSLNRKMDDFDNFHDNFDEIQDNIQPDTFSQTESDVFESTEDHNKYDGTNLWLIAALISLTIIHSFSDKWISWVRLFFKTNLKYQIIVQNKMIMYARHFAFNRVEFACKKVSKQEKFEMKIRFAAFMYLVDMFQAYFICLNLTFVK